MKRSTFITWDQLKVGLLALAALAVLGVAMVQLGQAAKLFTRRYTLVALVPNSGGLRQGGQVTVAGVLAGTVRSIDFLPPDGDTTRNLKVTVDIDRDLQPQVRADSRAKLRTQGLLGDKVFDISPGTPRFNVLRDGDTLRLDPSLDYEAVLAQAAGAVGDLIALTRDLQAITGRLVRGEGTAGRLLTDRSLYQDLTATLSRANGLLARLQSSNGTVGRLLDDPSLYRDLTRTVASVDSLVTVMRTSQGTLGRLVKDDSLYRSLVGVTAHADSLMRQVSAGNGLAAKLLTDQTLYDQLVKAVTDLNAILADVRQNPGKYTKGIIKVF